MKRRSQGLPWLWLPSHPQWLDLKKPGDFGCEPALGGQVQRPASSRDRVSSVLSVPHTGKNIAPRD